MPVLESVFLKIKLKKGLQHRYFSVNFAKFLRKTFVIQTPPVAAYVY